MSKGVTGNRPGVPKWVPGPGVRHPSAQDSWDESSAFAATARSGVVSDDSPVLEPFIIAMHPCITPMPFSIMPAGFMLLIMLLHFFIMARSSMIGFRGIAPGNGALTTCPGLRNMLRVSLYTYERARI